VRIKCNWINTFVAALQRRHYADALQLARQSQSSKVEVDFAVGEIILQGQPIPHNSI